MKLPWENVSIISNQPPSYNVSAAFTKTELRWGSRETFAKGKFNFQPFCLMKQATASLLSSTLTLVARSMKRYLSNPSSFVNGWKLLVKAERACASPLKSLMWNFAQITYRDLTRHFLIHRPFHLIQNTTAALSGPANFQPPPPRSLLDQLVRK